MSVAIIIVVISFLLDALISNHIGYTLTDPSIFKTIFTIVSLVSIYPYFNNDKKYLYILIITGILFDIIYTGTFLFVTLIFVIIYLVNKFLDFFLPFNLLNINILSIVSIYIYHILSFIILNLVKYNSYNINLLFNIILHSIISTIIYTTIIYFILRYIYNRLNIKQIR